VAGRGSTTIVAIFALNQEPRVAIVTPFSEAEAASTAWRAYQARGTHADLARTPQIWLSKWGQLWKLTGAAPPPAASMPRRPSSLARPTAETQGLTVPPAEKTGVAPE